jgi:uncharacterized membrane protein
MLRVTGWGHALFAGGVLGLGVLGLIYGDFALVWQQVPAWVPGRTGIAYACGALMLAAGVGLLWKPAALGACRALLIYLAAWLLLLRVPQLFIAPLQVVSWSGCGENAVMVAGAWALYVRLNPASPVNAGTSLRGARRLLGVALLPCGLAHLAYSQATAGLVPAWLPAHLAWAYLTGAGFMAAGIGVLASIAAHLAAILVTAMMAIFTLLVWVPGVWSAPGDRLQWTALFMSWVISAASWVVADSYRGERMSTSPAF